MVENIWMNTDATYLQRATEVGQLGAIHGAVELGKVTTVATYHHQHALSEYKAIF